jgi:membrane fusion protein
MSDPLFRTEALAARATSHLGTIRLAQPIGHRVATVLAAAIVVAVVTFVVAGAYTRRATVPGVLEPVGGTLRVTSVVAGIVESVPVVEGQRVVRGDPLFVLSGERHSTSGAADTQIAQRVDERRAAVDRAARLADERDRQRGHALRQRARSIDDEIARVARQTTINTARQRIARENVDRFEALARTGFVATAQLQARTDEWLTLQAAGEDYARQAITLARERATLEDQRVDSRMQTEAERTDLDRQRAALEQERNENDARRSIVVIAPRDGTVTGIAASPGQVVAAGLALATLIPDDGRLRAHLFASTRQAGFIRTGQPVHLRYAAYPFQKFGTAGGVVTSVAQSPYAPQELPSPIVAVLGSAAIGEPVYRIDVALDHQTIRTYDTEQALRPGMVFDADILQDRRRLIEWLLDPILARTSR